MYAEGFPVSPRMDKEGAMTKRVRISSLVAPQNSTPVDTFLYERKVYAQGSAGVAGLDEAGRGPLAGPVVAACVILPPDCDFHIFKDSKQISAQRRNELYRILLANGAAIGIGSASPREIEQINILQASLLAMRRATEACCLSGKSRLPDHLLVDGTFQVPIPIGQQTLIKGENKSASIAAASIIAKVTRDSWMAEHHVRYPQYNFNRNQGYPTKEHRQAISLFGPCPLHRRTFKGVREYIASDGQPAAFAVLPALS